MSSNSCQRGSTASSTHINDRLEPTITLPQELEGVNYQLVFEFPAGGVTWQHGKQLIEGLINYSRDVRFRDLQQEADTAPPVLPPLPEFFESPQGTDSMGGLTPRPVAASITVLDADGVELATCGNLTGFSDVRFSASLRTQYPYFQLLFREVVGKDTQNRPSQQLEVDIDQLKEFDISICDGTPQELRDAQRMQPDKRGSVSQLGVITFRCGPGQRPASTYSHRPLPANLPAATFLAAVPTGAQFKVLCRLQDGRRSQGTIAGFEEYIYIVKTLRRLTPDRAPRNDWLFSRDENIIPAWQNAFNMYIKSEVHNLGLFSPPIHLAKDDSRRTFGSVYNDVIKEKPVPRVSYPSVKAYIMHAMPAVLYKRTHAAHALQDQYNRHVSYRAVVKEVDRDRHKFLVSVRLSAKATDGEGRSSRIVLADEHKVQIWITPALDFDDVDAAFTSVVVSENRDDTDFTAKHKVYIVAEHRDPTSTVVLQRLVELAHIQPRALRPRPVHAGPRPFTFNVNNIISEENVSVRSPDLIEEFRQRSGDKEFEEKKRVNLQLIKRLKQDAKLNNEQKHFFDNAIKGALSGVVILQGLLGTGKSKTLAVLIIAVRLLDLKIVASAHSNFGADEIFDKVMELIAKHDYLAHLAKDCVRVHHGQREKQFFDNLNSDLASIVPRGCLARRVDKFAKANPCLNKWTNDFLRFKNSRRIAGEKAGRKPSGPEFEKVWDMVQTETMRTIKFVLATTFAAANIAEARYANY